MVGETYKDLLHQLMLGLALNPQIRFVGYNTAYGHKMNGTLQGCEHLCIETPVAENLMTGIAAGLSLEGYLPVLCFERADFLLAAADALINHLSHLQRYGLCLPILIRVCIGSSAPLDPGSQHTNDYSEIFERFTAIPVVRLQTCADVKSCLLHRIIERPLMLVEYRRLYDQTT